MIYSSHEPGPAVRLLTCVIKDEHPEQELMVVINKEVLSLDWGTPRLPIKCQGSLESKLFKIIFLHSSSRFLHFFLFL